MVCQGQRDRYIARGGVPGSVETDSCARVRGDG